jgi:hypothetical protein
VTSKPSNPKDQIGSGKLPLGLVPQTGIVLEALAFLEGGLKYGAHNYRAVGVRSSIYKDAAMRHMMKWWNGEECDPKTKVPHLASARACLNVILDAQSMNLLTDDRPPSNPKLVNMIDGLMDNVSHLKNVFKDHSPRHYTIKDSKKVKKDT